MGNCRPKNVGSLQGTGSLNFFVYGNPQRFQETLILSCETNLPGCRYFLRFGRVFRFGGLLIGLITLVETDSRFQNEEDIVAGPFDFADRFCNALGIGQRIVDRVSQVLHQALKTFIHGLPLSSGAAHTKARILEGSYSFLMQLQGHRLLVEIFSETHPRCLLPVLMFTRLYRPCKE